MSAVVQRPEKPKAQMPKGFVVLAGALVLFIIAIAGTARISHNNRVILPPTTAIASRDLSFKDLPDGGVDVSDAVTGAHIYTVVPTTGGFLRGVMRGLVRDHRQIGGVSHTSFRLTRWADGRLSIEDPATHETYELEAFGSTNEAVFAQFLEDPKTHGPIGAETR